VYLGKKTNKVRGKWKAAIILSLYNMPLRFNKIKQVTGCNSYSLAKNLKQLENSCIVLKTGDAHSKYKLTNDGNKIARLLIQLEEILNRLP
jgi:DNA-binding HxlR family transcriptional regulator